MNGQRLQELKLARSGDRETAGKLLEENSGLIWSVCRRFFGRGTDPEDLYQLGCLGFLKALEGFDPDYGTQFSTYAVPKIAGEIRRFLRDDGIIKFSRGAKSLAARVRNELTEDPDLTIDLLAEKLHASREELAAALASDSPIGSLDEALPDGSGNLFDRIGTESEEERSVRRLTLDAALGSLSDRERILVHLRYREEKTQTEVGRLLGISQVQVSRLEKKILSELRNRMQD